MQASAGLGQVRSVMGREYQRDLPITPRHLLVDLQTNHARGDAST